MNRAPTTPCEPVFATASGGRSNPGALSRLDLADIVRLRPLADAGLLMALTRRCPLSCAHCSTSSTMTAEQAGTAALLRFTRSFTAEDRPDVVMFTGGEPLLRPRLVIDLAAAVRRVGAR